MTSRQGFNKKKHGGLTRENHDYPCLPVTPLGAVLFSCITGVEHGLQAGLQLSEVHPLDLLDQIKADEGPIREQVRVKRSPTDCLERQCGLDDAFRASDITGTDHCDRDDVLDREPEQFRPFGAGLVETFQRDRGVVAEVLDDRDELLDAGQVLRRQLELLGDKQLDVACRFVRQVEFGVAFE